MLNTKTVNEISIYVKKSYVDIYSGEQVLSNEQAMAITLSIVAIIEKNKNALSDLEEGLNRQ